MKDDLGTSFDEALMRYDTFRIDQENSRAGCTPCPFECREYHTITATREKPEEKRAPVSVCQRSVSISAPQFCVAQNTGDLSTATSFHCGKDLDARILTRPPLHELFPGGSDAVRHGSLRTRCRWRSPCACRNTWTYCRMTRTRRQPGKSPVACTQLRSFGQRLH